MLEPDQVQNDADARQIVEQRNLTHVKVGVFDIDGVLRGKYMSRDKFFSALENGFGFCDVVLGWDSNDQLYDNVQYTGWHTGYPDAPVNLLPQSCRELPGQDGGLFFLGEFAPPADTLCPRGVLRRAVSHARKLGFEPYGALEYEFFLFDETPQSASDKRYHDLRPLTPGNFGYSVLRASVWSDFHRDLLRLAEQMRFPLEGLHTETGPGVMEAAIAVDEALEAGDRAALFKTFTKVLAQRNEIMATFMARWSPQYPGQSGHVHLSLRGPAGETVFHDASAQYGISATMRHFIGGCQLLMPQVLALIASTVNAYRRLVPGFWAPTNATWGIENRTCALRVVHGSPKSQRVEYRVAAADANPYLALAAALVSGLHGIVERIEPTQPVEGNAYEQAQSQLPPFPATLWDAAQRLRQCQVARDVLGEAFVDHFAATREWEEREFRKHITDWELKRYFEII
jgi:glutamine synthetase